MHAHRYMGNIGKPKSKTHYAPGGPDVTFGVSACGITVGPTSPGTLTGRVLAVTCKRCVAAMMPGAQLAWREEYVYKSRATTAETGAEKKD